MRLHLLPHCMEFGSTGQRLCIPALRLKFEQFYSQFMRPLMQCLNRLQRRIGFAVVQATAPALDNASEPAQILVLPLQIKQPRPQFIQLLPGF